MPVNPFTGFVPVLSGRARTGRREFDSLRADQFFAADSAADTFDADIAQLEEHDATIVEVVDSNSTVRSTVQ